MRPSSVYLFTMLPVYRALLLAAALCCTALTQTTSSVLTGVVKDSTGAVVTGASVRVVNQDTGVPLRP